MTKPQERIEQFDQVPSNRYYGFELTHHEVHAAVVTLNPRPEQAQDHGIVQGGILVGLCDVAGVYAVYPYLPEGHTMTSVELKLNFLRPVFPGAGPVHARAEAVQVGSRIAVLEVTAEQGGKDVAKGLFTYLIFERGNDADPAQAGGGS